MDETVLLAIPVAVFLTSTLSGVFGMGGGLLLMAFYATILPVPEAMVLHGATQLASNGFRAALLARHVVPRVCLAYLFGAVIGGLACVFLDIEIGRAQLFVALGALPLVGVCLRPSLRFGVERGGVAVLCGTVVTSAQLVAGVSGPLLDLFFVRTTLDRRAVIGTKAVTQCVGHLTKLLYFVPRLAEPEPTRAATLPVAAFALSIAFAAAGTATGRMLLERREERRFRRISTALVTALSVVLLARGLALFATQG
jgi:uncharacterized membrane protein YfcA